MVAFEPKNLLKISTLAACLTRVNGVAEFCSSSMFPPQNHHCVYWGRCILGRQMFGRIDAIEMFSMVQLGWPHFPENVYMVSIATLCVISLPTITLDAASCQKTFSEVNWKDPSK